MKKTKKIDKNESIVLYCTMHKQGTCPYENKDNGSCRIKDPCTNHTTENPSTKKKN